MNICPYRRKRNTRRTLQYRRRTCRAIKLIVPSIIKHYNRFQLPLNCAPSGYTLLLRYYYFHAYSYLPFTSERMYIYMYIYAQGYMYIYKRVCVIMYIIVYVRIRYKPVCACVWILLATRSGNVIVMEKIKNKSFFARQFVFLSL